MPIFLKGFGSRIGPGRGAKTPRIVIGLTPATDSARNLIRLLSPGLPMNLVAKGNATFTR